MPRDYKIGIAIGLLVVIAGVAYFVITGGGEDPQPNPQPAQQEKNNLLSLSNPDGNTSETAIPLDELPAPPPDPEEDEVAAVVVRPEVSAREDDEESETVDFNFDPPPSPTVVRAETREGMDAGVDPAAAAEGAFSEANPAEAGGYELYHDADEALVASDPEPVEYSSAPVRTAERTTESYRSLRDRPRTETEMAPVRSGRATVRTVSAAPLTPPPDSATTATTMAATRTYKVTEGDTSGFWGISKKVYGTSKHFGLIEKANPNVDPRRLRPGTMLRIPPKPVESATTSMTQNRNTQQGGFSTNAAGQRVYTVSQDDTGGLWGIAVKAYGKGHLNELIAEANPNVDSNRLNPGDKLIIPPAPAEQPVRSPAVSSALQAARAQEGQTLMENGKRYYVVASADNGFWTAAKKVYGDGKYMYVIAEANPGLDPVLLQPGDKVYVPPLPPEPQRRRAAPVSSGSGGLVAEPVRRSGGLPEPDFGP